MFLVFLQTPFRHPQFLKNETLNFRRFEISIIYLNNL